MSHYHHHYDNFRVNMADAKFSFQEKGKMYHPAWIAPEVCHHHHYIFIIIVLFWESSSLSPCLIVPEVCHMYHGHRHGHLHHYCYLIFEISIKMFLSFQAMSKSPADINVRAADMWSYAVLLWELATRWWWWWLWWWWWWWWQWCWWWWWDL